MYSLCFCPKVQGAKTALFTSRSVNARLPLSSADENSIACCPKQTAKYEKMSLKLKGDLLGSREGHYEGVNPRRAVYMQGNDK